MKRSRVKAKAIAAKETVEKTIVPFALLFLLGLLLIALPLRAEDTETEKTSQATTEDAKPKDCNGRCDVAKKQCITFCEETHEDSDDAKSCENKCEFVFDEYCKDSCKSDEKFSFSCQDEETNADDVDCIEGCESHYAIVALNCNEKFKDDSKARQKCFENAASLVDDTGFCYGSCATDPAYACEPK